MYHPGCYSLHKAVYNDCINCIILYLTNGTDINEKDSAGLAPIHYACFSRINTLKTLVEHGANIENKTNKGLTPLYLSIIKQSGPLYISFFLDNDADPFVEIVDGKSCYDIANDEEKKIIDNYISTKDIKEPGFD